MSTYNRMLVPLDESELSERVLDTALGTAAWSGAEVVLLKVVEGAASLDLEQARTDLAVLDREVSDLLERATARLGSLPLERSRIRAEVRSGSVVNAIVGACEEAQCDLIIMGTHGRHGLTEMLTGSTTEQVLAKAPASVFVVRPQGYPFLRD